MIQTRNWCRMQKSCNSASTALADGYNLQHDRAIASWLISSQAELNFSHSIHTELGTITGAFKRNLVRLQSMQPHTRGPNFEGALQLTLPQFPIVRRILGDSEVFRDVREIGDALVSLSLALNVGYAKVFTT